MSEQDKYTTIKTYVDEDVASYLSQIARGAGVTPSQAAAVLLAWSYQSTPFPAPGEEQDPDTTQASTEQAGDEARPEGEADAPTPGRSDREAEAEGVTRTPQEKMRSEERRGGKE